MGITSVPPISECWGRTTKRVRVKAHSKLVRATKMSCIIKGPAWVLLNPGSLPVFQPSLHWNPPGISCHPIYFSAWYICSCTVTQILPSQEHLPCTEPSPACKRSSALATTNVMNELAEQSRIWPSRYHSARFYKTFFKNFPYGIRLYPHSN